MVAVGAIEILAAGNVVKIPCPVDLGVDSTVATLFCYFVVNVQFEIGPIFLNDLCLFLMYMCPAVLINKCWDDGVYI